MVIRDLRVSDVMTRSPITVSPDMDILECSKILVKKRVGSLILHDSKKIRGILTEKDIVWALSKKSKKDLKDVKARDIASKKVKGVKPSVALSKALKLMKKTGFRRLPVIYRGKLVGMVTIKDILRIEPALYPDISEAMEIKEASEKMKRREMMADRPESLKQGICEDCGNYDWLYKLDGRVICESCMDMM